MKFIKKSIYAMMLVGIGLTWSCSTDELNAPDDGQQPASDTQSETSSGTMTFTAAMGSKSLSKSHVAYYNGHTWFDPEDAIGVFPIPASDVSQSSEFKFDQNTVYDDKAMADFTGPQMTSENGYFAMLPYQENASLAINDDGDGVITMTLPTEQKTVYEELMVGYTPTQNKSFKLKHVGAMLRFATAREYGKIEIEAPEGTMIAGDNVQVTIDKEGTIDNEVKIKSVTGGTSNKITVDLKTRGIEAQGDSVLVTLLPCTVEKLKITFYNNNKKPTVLFPHEIDGAKTLQSGVMYSYGNVGRWIVTCYEEDKDDSKVLFTMYTTERGTNTKYYNKMVLPFLKQQPAQEGYLYAYLERGTNGPIYYPNQPQDIPGDLNLFLYPVKAINVSIYGNGADAEPTLDTLVYNNTDITLPPIKLEETDGKTYGYSFAANGEVEAIPGESTLINVEDEAITSVAIYAVQKDAQVFNIYGDGADQDPTFTKAVPKNYSTTFDLPELPAEDGKRSGYSTTPGGNIEFLAGSVNTTNSMFSKLNPVNFYPVYVDYLVPTSAATTYTAYAIDGLGDANSTEQQYLEGDLPKIAKGTAMEFKIKNNNPSADQSKYVKILLCGVNNAHIGSSKQLNVYSTADNYSRKPSSTTKTKFLNSLKEAEMTVKITNYGGFIDVECSWDYTEGNKTTTYSFKYQDIVFETDNKINEENPDHDLFVSFLIEGSTIEFVK